MVERVSFTVLCYKSYQNHKNDDSLNEENSLICMAENILAKKLLTDLNIKVENVKDVEQKLLLIDIYLQIHLKKKYWVQAVENTNVTIENLIAHVDLIIQRIKYVLQLGVQYRKNIFYFNFIFFICAMSRYIYI